MKELVAWYKANPTKANYGSPAPGSLPHFFGVMIAKGADVELVHIPYNGGAPMMNALMGDQLSAAIDTTVEQVELHRTGRVRILATSGATRSALLPEVPTFVESGLPGVEGTAWFAVYAPAKTPEATIRQLNAAVNKALAAPELRERFTKLGLEPSGGTAPSSARGWRRTRRAGRRSSRPRDFAPTDAPAAAIIGGDPAFDRIDVDRQAVAIAPRRDRRLHEAENRVEAIAARVVDERGAQRRRSARAKPKRSAPDSRPATIASRAARRSSRRCSCTSAGRQRVREPARIRLERDALRIAGVVDAGNVTPESIRRPTPS